MDPTAKFIVGQRVVVNKPLVDLLEGRRYYGHVESVELPDRENNPFRVALYWVKLLGCVGDSSALHTELLAASLPFFEPELEAID